MSDQPKCDKCGLEITSGLMAAYCSQGRECELWPHSNGDVQLAGGELLMYRFWMDNTLEQIGLHIIEDRKRLERELAEARSVISDGAKWVTVEERVPADDKTVLVCLHPGQIVTGWWAPGINEWRDCSNGARFVDMGMNVTHWMPLPEAPK